MRRNEFHALYERYADDVYRFTFWLTRDPVEAEELTAETFARAWMARDRIRVKTMKAYLLTIARNLRRKQLRRHDLPASGSVEGLTVASGEGRLLQREELGLVWEELRRLKEEDRATFLLRVSQELPYDEVARILRISVSSAKVKVHRVRLRLALAVGRRGKRGQ